METRTTLPNGQCAARPWWWYLAVAIAATLLTEPNLTLWVMQMVVLHKSPASALRFAVAGTTILDLLFTAAIRIAPFIVFGLVAYQLARSRARIPHEFGFTCAIVACAAAILLANWGVFLDFFAKAPFHSDVGVAFLLIPFYGGVIGAVSALFGTGVHWVLHRSGP